MKGSIEKRDAGEFELPEMGVALAGRLRALTPARVGLRRSGISLATSEVLDFQLAHARARDAVHAALEPASLLAALRGFEGWNADVEALLLHAAAADRLTYLQRPDLGRRLNEASRRLLRDHAGHSLSVSYDLAIVIVDGLSALAVERHALLLMEELLAGIQSYLPTFRLAPVCVVEQGRVAVGDEVGKALGAEMVLVLIGERPGLSSPDSLGAYITWRPEPGSTKDAERNCVSNIRLEGLSYAEAAARLVHYIVEARSAQATGILLKDPVVQAQRLVNGVER